MQLNQLEILSYVTIMHQPVTVSSNTCIQTYVQIKHFLAHLQHLTPTLAVVITYISSTSQKSFICARQCLYNWLHVFELTVTGWCIIVT